MNCQDAQHSIHDYLDGELPARASAQIEAHLIDCEACRTAVEDEQSIRNLLRGLPVEPVSDGFIERALRVAQQPGSPVHGYAKVHAVRELRNRGFIWGFGSAAVAGLVMWMVLGLFPVENALDQDGFKPVQIALYETHNLKLAFYSKQARNGARISIHLPENVELVGFPEKRSLKWATNLTEGDNLLVLPIKALSLNNSELIATVEYGKQVKTLKVKLHTTRPGITQNKRDPLVFT